MNTKPSDTGKYSKQDKCPASCEFVVRADRLDTELDRVCGELAVSRAETESVQAEVERLKKEVWNADSISYRESRKCDYAITEAQKANAERDAALAQLASEKARADKLHDIAAGQAKDLAEACKALELAERVVNENQWSRDHAIAEAAREWAKSFGEDAEDYDTDTTERALLAAVEANK